MAILTNIIPFPKPKRPTPEKIKAVESVRSNQLLMQFVDVCNLPIHKQADGFRKLRVVIFDYVFFEMNKGVQS
ncbi:MAG: hypothetical protein KZQ83_17465 [gamma proteobacterium symbiont of Taylorina sp.]|nr:hypothetical protein [gamma proteobacterium symbiont of Taylorina sp.]